MIRWAVPLGVLLACLTAVSQASATVPWWNVSSTARPASLPPGGEGTILVKALNVGDETSSGDVTISDVLPAGVAAQSVGLFSTPVGAGRVDLSFLGTCETSPGRVQCVYPEYMPTLRPYEYVELQIAVKVEPGAASGPSHVQVSGGGAPRASLEQPLVVDGSSTPFGVEDFRMVPEEEGGAVDTRAGSHPFQLSTTLALNQTADVSKPPALPKDLRFDLPPGLVGDATAVAQCSERDFSQLSPLGSSNLCSANTVIGVATVDVYTNILESYSVPLFNLTPARGEPARFGFEVVRAPVTIDTSVRSGRDYGVVASTSNITQLAGFLDTQLTFWGVPGDPRHDSSRGWACVEGGQNIGESEPCVPEAQHSPAPLLTLPTACEGPLSVALEGDSWPTSANPQGIVLPRMEYAPKDMFGRPLGMTGCDQLPFSPSITVTPETHAASTPTGLDVDVHLPQDTTSTVSGLGEAAIRQATVTLPQGMSLDPSGAGGLEACSEGQVGFEGAAEDGTQLFSPSIGEPFCPDASKVGTARIDVPILPNPLEGSVYVAAQNTNPFGSLVAIYIVANDPVSGVLVKLAGEVALDPVTGQLTSTFKNTPQAPVEDLELHFFGGPRGPLVTPAACGTYTTSASFAPWSGTSAVNASSAFEVTSGPGGTACQSPQPFAPSFTAGTTSPQAGAFSPFTASLTRGDGDQGLSGVSVRTPPGVLGIIKGVERCPEPQAAQGACGAGSLIGHTTVAAGAGSEPFDEQGQVFLTGPYKGAPFGLSIVVPAVAGPFNLGNVVVRAAIHVDPHTARIAVVSDPLPTILQGIPLLVKKVNVTIDRPRFMFNPTDCEPLSVDGSLTSTQGAQAEVSSRFQAVNCATLPFKPSFKVSSQARTSKRNGASLDVKVGSGAGQANIGKVAVSLPKQLPSRLTTIQQACPQATFAQNPASCPAGSTIGTATATTPVLALPVTGPAYLVSHGGAAFPDLVLILQGEGVTLELVGSIDIKKGVTSSTFASVPDAPISSFELKLPEGPHSGLTAVLPAKAKGSLCGTSLAMPTTLTGQNGAQIRQSTKIAVTGCAKAKKKAKARKKHGATANSRQKAKRK